MNRQMIEIRPYRHSATHPWVITGAKVNGKRKRYFFKTKQAAELELARMQIKLAREGQAALDFDDHARVDALRARQLLSPYGKTLVDAARFLVTHLEINQKSITVLALTDEYLANQKRLGRSYRHLLDMRSRLGRFAQSFGQRPVKTITTAEIEQWLYSLEGLGPVSINCFIVRVGVLFNYGIKRGYLEKNPLGGIDRFKEIDKPVEIFTVQQMTALLNAAPAQLLPVLAIGAFAGLRTAELLRLHWSEVGMAGGYVRVPATKAKSARRRLISIQPNLKDWLGICRTALSGPIWPKSPAQFHADVHTLCRRAGLKWVDNGLRHSFASYRLAAGAEINQVALDMGHTSTALLFSNYREITTPEEAARYWAIGPKESRSNVVEAEFAA
jgi:integrase